MICDTCGKRIGNTLYMVGQTRLCPVCHLGEKEGKKEKYQQFDASWTEPKLKAHKNKVKEAREKALEKIRNARDGG